jgi:hypothetical protein
MGKRSALRKLKTVSLPVAVVARLQEEADTAFGGDFTRALIYRLSSELREARDFLAETRVFRRKSKKPPTGKPLWQTICGQSDEK